MQKTGKSDWLIGLAVVGAVVGVGLYATGQFKGISDFFSGLLGRPAIAEATKKIEEQTTVITGLTEKVEQMQLEHHEKTLSILEQLENVQRLAEASVVREETIADAYAKLLEEMRTTQVETILKTAAPESALHVLAVTQPTTLEWLARNLPYAVGL